MAAASPLYKKAVIIGATSGIGLSLASRLIGQGTKVIVTGRRQSRLDDFVSKYGADKASGYNLDVLDLRSIPIVAHKIVADHPDVDAVVINAGIQRPFNFAQPSTVDFDSFDTELTTNYTAAVHLAMAFLPHLKAHGQETSLVFVSSALALVPTMLRCANYNASKAAVHFFVMAFREQLRRAVDDPGARRVRVVEVFPPGVQTEMHDEHHQPDLKNGREIGMPVEDFTDAMIDGLRRGMPQFAVGLGEAYLNGFEGQMQKVFSEQVDMVEGNLKRFMK